MGLLVCARPTELCCTPSDGVSRAVTRGIVADLTITLRRIAVLPPGVPHSRVVPGDERVGDMTEFLQQIADRLEAARASLAEARLEGDDYLTQVRLGEIESLQRLMDEHRTPDTIILDTASLAATTLHQRAGVS